MTASELKEKIKVLVKKYTKKKAKEKMLLSHMMS
jgi:hypothetical protein